MTAIKHINLDLLNTSITEVVVAKQNDRDARWIYCNLFSGSQPFIVPNGIAAIIRIRKPDGKAVVYDTDEGGNQAVIIDGNTVQVELVEQALTAPGNAHAEVNLYSEDGERLTSFSFVIKIERSVIDDAEIISSDYFNILTATLAEMIEVYENTLDAAAKMPIPNETTGTWWIYNADTGEYEDSGEPYQGEDGADGQDGAAATIEVGTVETLPAGVPATVENVGTDTTAIFNFGIPEGPPGVGDGYITYTHEKDGNVHTLTSPDDGDNIKFTVTADYADGDIFEVNGVTCTAQTTDGEPLPGGYFVAGAVVSCFLSGTVLNFGDGGARVYSNAGSHNSIYRGKNLGTSVTADQYAAIADNTFKDMYIGDYWVIGGVTWRIAALNYFHRAGDTDLTTPHITIVPDTALYNHVMNDTDVTTGGYVGSKMYTAGLAQAKSIINAAFGAAHILNHRQYLCNAVTNGRPSGGSWYDSTVELMTEQNVYGGKIYGTTSDGTNISTLATIDKSQYPLFTFRPDLISYRQSCWLRDILSNAHFALVRNYGSASNASASNSNGVRPSFSIIS